MSDDMVQAFRNLRDVSYIDNLTLEQAKDKFRTHYNEKHRELTGVDATLDRADSESIVFDTNAVMWYQLAQFENRIGQQNSLKTATGVHLDHLAANFGVVRLAASPARAMIRFTLSAVQLSPVLIPAGTRVTGNGLYFTTEDAAEISAGELSITIPCVCEQAGTIGNAIQPSVLKTLVDRLPYIATVENVEATAGGADTEDDEALRERAFLAPGGYSVAGPDLAYIFHAKSFSSSIGSVAVDSPEPVDVVVYILLKDGSLPSQGLLDGVQEHLRDDNIRPLTDRVTVKAPEIVFYDLDVTYYVARSMSDQAATIQAAVMAAISQFNAWQTQSIGRDINPSELIRRIVDAGAKRVEVRSPVFSTVRPSQVARNNLLTVTYGGIEDD